MPKYIAVSEAIRYVRLDKGSETGMSDCREQRSSVTRHVGRQFSNIFTSQPESAIPGTPQRENSREAQVGGIDPINADDAFSSETWVFVNEESKSRL